MSPITKRHLLSVIAAFTAELAGLVKDGREHCVRAQALRNSLHNLNQILEAL